jgi:predicted O-methyltransferase YrrM
MSDRGLGRRLLDRFERGVESFTRSSDVRGKLGRAGVAYASKIPTHVSRIELHTLLALSSRVPDQGRALEIGSYLGASTCYLAAGLAGRGATLTCVDTWQNETMPEGPRDTYDQFKRNVAPLGKMIHILRSRSNQLTPADLPQDLELVFLDADHQYASVRSDFALVAPNVAPSGVIAFHDSLYFEGVSRVIGEALANGDWRLAGCTGNLSWICRAAAVTRAPNQH